MRPDILSATGMAKLGQLSDEDTMEDLRKRPGAKTQQRGIPMDPDGAVILGSYGLHSEIHAARQKARRRAPRLSSGEFIRSGNI
jgi:hypothetical protein